jgi:aldose 1-epimerase
MYIHTVSKFGRYDSHRFSDADGHNSFTIVPAFGATLLEIVLDGESVLEGYETPELMEVNKWAKSAFLFPYPNRLKDGCYTFGGKKYQFELNNAATQNSIHGFGKDAPMEVVEQVVSEKKAVLKCAYTYDGRHKAYPFKFSVQLEFRLVGNHFEVFMSLTNLSDTFIPAGLGWHPYFRIADRVDEVSLQMPPSKMIEIDNRMIPTGKKTDFNDYNKLSPIGGNTLDNGFYLTQKKGKASVVLSSKKGKLDYWQETGVGRWNFIQVFTPPHRTAIALEPMTCNIDAFNNEDGLVVLSPEACLSGRFGLSFVKNK